MKRISIVSKDIRFETVNKRLSESGYESVIVSDDCIGEADYYIFPVRLGMTDDKLSGILKNIDESATVFSGEGERVKSFFRGNVVDYTADDNFIFRNAYLTAEAATIVAREKSKRSLLGAKAMVIGYGRIGKHLCGILKSGGAETYVYARRSASRIEALLNGIENTELIDIASMDFVFNTVPSVIVPEFITEKAKNTFIMELASKPGGFEDTECAYNGSGLPGRILPISAGEVVFDTVYSFLSLIEKGHNI